MVTKRRTALSEIHTRNLRTERVKGDENGIDKLLIEMKGLGAGGGWVRGGVLVTI